MNILNIIKKISLWVVTIILLSLVNLAFFNVIFVIDIINQADILFSLFALFFFDLFLGISLWFLSYPYIYSLKQRIYKQNNDDNFTPINSFKFIISIILHITVLIQLIIIGTPIRHKFTSIIDIFVFFELTILVIFVFSIIYTIKQIIEAIRQKSKKSKETSPTDESENKVFAETHITYGLLGILLALSFSVVIIISFSVLDMKGLVNGTSLLFSKLPLSKNFITYLDFQNHYFNRT